MALAIGDFSDVVCQKRFCLPEVAIGLRAEGLEDCQRLVVPASTCAASDFARGRGMLAALWPSPLTPYTASMHSKLAPRKLDTRQLPQRKPAILPRRKPRRMRQPRPRTAARRKPETARLPRQIVNRAFEHRRIIRIGDLGLRVGFVGAETERSTIDSTLARCDSRS